MFVDGRQTSGLPATVYDLIIVGGGPAGLTLANELKDLGLRIAVLESGGEDIDFEVQDLNEGILEGNDDEYELAPSRLRFLGGTSNHWGGHCTPLDELDFSRAPATGLSGWPITRASLDEYYARAHEYCDIGTYDYSPERLLGLKPSDELFPDNDEVETAVLRQSPPTNFGEKYGPVLRQNGNVDVWLWTTAVNVTTQQDDAMAVQTRSTFGPDRSFVAPVAVLAGGAIECARLVMHANALNGTRAGDAGGLLGKGYMDHPSGGAAFVRFQPKADNLIYWRDVKHDGIVLNFVSRLTDAAIEARGLPNFQFYVLPFLDDPVTAERRRVLARAGHASRLLAQWARGRRTLGTAGAWRRYCIVVDAADDYVVDQAHRLIRGESVSRALLKFEFEQRPDRTNGLRLNPDLRDALGVPQPILHWSPSDDDIGAIKQVARLYGEFAGAAGVGRVQLEDHDDDPYWNVTTAWHQLGLMRMAESPTQGVVDANCRVHGTKSLYVASGAVFPTSGRANPTLTIVALAIRLADHLKTRVRA